jgi:2OG-Fe(II) oxygenase superfamily
MLQMTEARLNLRNAGFVLVRNYLDVHESAEFASLASALTDRFGIDVVRSSRGDTLDYRVVTGDTIQAEAPVLFTLYTSRLLHWTREVTGHHGLAPSPHLRSAININCLERRNQHYPWHHDAVPFTALLFLTTLSDTDGGEFLIRTVRDDVVSIPPSRGDLLLMDGKRCAHAVAPLRENTRRLTVPMVYPLESDERPAGLDEYLYAGTQAK